MAANNQQWEVVKKTNKKDKQKNAPKLKAKDVIDKMPRIESAPPVKESPTLFDVLAPKEKAVSSKPEEKAKKTEKKKPSHKEKKVSTLTLEEALAKLDVNEYETQLAKVQAQFAGKPLLWMKDLVSILNNHLEKVPEADPTYSDKPCNYPMSLFPSKAKSLFKKVLNECSSDAQHLLLDHCIKNLLADVGKGSLHGFRIMAQILLRDKPDIALKNLKDHLKLIHSNQSKCHRCLSILWVIGQAGLNNLNRGLQVWLKLMLPLLGIKHLSPFAIQYLENLFNNEKDLSKGYSSIKMDEFFHILDLTYNSKSQLPNNLQKKLVTFLPNLKTVAIGKNPAKTLQIFFPSYLVRLTSDCSKQLKSELLNSLTECLTVNQHCYSVWSQMYIQHLTQSGILLEHLSQNYQKLRSQLHPPVLQNTIQAFNITNDELVLKNQEDERCVKYCQTLMTASHKSSFPWKSVIFFLILSCLGLVAFDSYYHKGYKNSLVNAFISQAHVKISHHTNICLMWLDAHAPVYWGKVCDFVNPYLKLAWEYCYDAGIFVIQSTAPAREWVNEKIPIVLEWVNAQLPWLMDGLKVWASWAWQHTHTAALTVYSHALVYMDKAGSWLLENVFVGKMSPENLLSMMTDAYTLASSYFSDLVQWGNQTYQQIAAKYEMAAHS